MAIAVEDVVRAGGKVKLGRGQTPFFVDTLALRILGLLADAPTMEVRRKALEKARRMLGKR